jgi:hypothetical protein
VLRWHHVSTITRCTVSLTYIRLEEGDEDATEDWEMGALAWGLITTGGLGLGSAAVYGAEVMAR